MNAAANHFYVTLFSNSSREIYMDNTLSAFTIKLAQLIELNYPEKWEVGIYEVTCPPPVVGTGAPKTTIGNTNVLDYRNVIAPQYIGSDMVRCLRTFIYPSKIAQMYLIKFITCRSNRGNLKRFESSF
jgi:hypothetical protein